MSHLAIAIVIVLAGTFTVGLVLVLRRAHPEAHTETGPASAILSYVAAAFGILLGFVIVFLLGQAANARQAIGDEATSIGTAFDEAQLFPEGELEIQRALICYSRAVTEEEWPALAERRSAPEADDAYRTLIAAYGDVEEPTDGTFQPAAATNSFVQIGGISTARVARLVAAESAVGPLMWVTLAGSALLVLVLLFAVSAPARPLAQALLMGLASVFSVILFTLVVVLNNPYHEELGPLTPRLIEENAERMTALAPDAAAEPCSFEEQR
jgi:hypothetical protein